MVAPAGERGLLKGKGARLGLAVGNAVGMWESSHSHQLSSHATSGPTTRRERRVGEPAMLTHEAVFVSPSAVQRPDEDDARREVTSRSH